jgi:hypothetical protein
MDVADSFDGTCSDECKAAPPPAAKQPAKLRGGKDSGKGPKNVIACIDKGGHATCEALGSDPLKFCHKGNIGCAPCPCLSNDDSFDGVCSDACQEHVRNGDPAPEGKGKGKGKGPFNLSKEARARVQRLKDGKPNEEDLKNADEAFKLLAPCKAHTDCEHEEFCHVVRKLGSSEVMGSGCAKCGECQVEQDGVGEECFQKCRKGRGGKGKGKGKGKGPWGKGGKGGKGKGMPMPPIIPCINQGGHAACKAGSFCHVGERGCAPCPCGELSHAFDGKCSDECLQTKQERGPAGNVEPKGAPGVDCKSHEGCKKGEFCHRYLGGRHDVTVNPPSSACNKCEDCEYNMDAIDGVCPAKCGGQSKVDL